MPFIFVSVSIKFIQIQVTSYEHYGVPNNRHLDCVFIVQTTNKGNVKALLWGESTVLSVFSSRKG